MGLKTLRRPYDSNEDLNKRSEQFVCVTCGSENMCKSCLRIPKEWLKQ